MIEQQSVHQQVDQACQQYEAEHGPVGSLIYREGVVQGVSIGLTLATEAYQLAYQLDREEGKGKQ